MPRQALRKSFRLGKDLRRLQMCKSGWELAQWQRIKQANTQGHVFGLAVRCWSGHSHPTLEGLGSIPTSGSWLQPSAKADPGRQQVMAQALGLCHPRGRSRLSSWFPALASDQPWLSVVDQWMRVFSLFLSLSSVCACVCVWKLYILMKGENLISRDTTLLSVQFSETVKHKTYN